MYCIAKSYSFWFHANLSISSKNCEYYTEFCLFQNLIDTLYIIYTSYIMYRVSIKFWKIQNGKMLCNNQIWRESMMIWHLAKALTASLEFKSWTWEGFKFFTLRFVAGKDAASHHGWLEVFLRVVLMYFQVLHN